MEELIGSDAINQIINGNSHKAAYIRLSCIRVFSNRSLILSFTQCSHTSIFNRLNVDIIYYECICFNRGKGPAACVYSISLPATHPPPRFFKTILLSIPQLCRLPFEGLVRVIGLLVEIPAETYSRLHTGAGVNVVLLTDLLTIWCTLKMQAHSHSGRNFEAPMELSTCWLGCASPCLTTSQHPSFLFTLNFLKVGKTLVSHARSFKTTRESKSPCDPRVIISTCEAHVLTLWVIQIVAHVYEELRYQSNKSNTNIFGSADRFRGGINGTQIDPMSTPEKMMAQVRHVQSIEPHKILALLVLEPGISGFSLHISYRYSTTAHQSLNYSHGCVNELL